jgi:hypothetical protein
MEPFVIIYGIGAIALIVWFVLYIRCLVKRHTVKASDMLSFSLFCFFASVVVGITAAYALDAAVLLEKEHVESIIKGHYQVANVTDLTQAQLFSLSDVLVGRMDKGLMVRAFLEQALAGFIKLFVPLFIGAVGVWSLEKYMSAKLVVVPDGA